MYALYFIIICHKQATRNAPPPPPPLLSPSPCHCRFGGGRGSFKDYFARQQICFFDVFHIRSHAVNAFKIIKQKRVDVGLTSGHLIYLADPVRKKYIANITMGLYRNPMLRLNIELFRCNIKAPIRGVMLFGRPLLVSGNEGNTTCCI